MASPYPSGFDNFPTDKADASVSATDHHNDLADAINKIQATLGLNPAVALAHTPFGPDLVTGNSQTFLTGLGDWVEVGGGTLTWEDVGFTQGHPLNPKTSPEGLKFVASINGDTIRLPIVGTFLAGQTYIASLLLQSSTDTDPWDIYFGEDGQVDGQTTSFYSGGWRLLTATWLPTADRSDVVLEVIYNGAITPTLDVFYCKVAERRDYLAAAGFALSGATGGALYDFSGSLIAQFSNIGIYAEGSLEVDTRSTFHIFGAPGLSAANRPALETATDEATVVVGYNLIRTMLIALGLATDGD